MRPALLLVFLSIFLPALASAQDRVSISAEVHGAGAAGPQRTVRDAIQSDPRAELVDSGGDLRISGEITGRGRRRMLSLTATDASGNELGSERGRVASDAAVTSAVARLLDTVIPVVQSRTTATVTRTETTQTTTSRDTSDEPTPTPTPRTSSSSGSTPSGGGSSFGAGVPLFVAQVGVGLRSRDTGIDVAGGMTRAYHASPYAELYLRLDARPLGSANDYTRGIFLWGDFGYAVGLSSQLPDRTQVSTTFLRGSVHAGYLLPIESYLEIGASFGFGWEHYDLGANSVLPTVDYPYLRPAARIRFRLVGEMVVLAFDAGYRALLSRDGLGGAFGAGGDSFGYDLGGSVSGAFDFGLAYGIEAGWSQFVHSFSGNGTLAQGSHGQDGGYRVMITLGYALR